MPSAHRIALKKLLEVTEREIALGEVRLLKAQNDEEREKLIERLADLHVTQSQTRAALLEEDQP